MTRWALLVGDEAAGRALHAKCSPLADAYFSQAALRWDSYAVKVGMVPVCPALVTAIDRTLDNLCRPGRFPRAVVSCMRA